MNSVDYPENLAKIENKVGDATRIKWDPVNFEEEEEVGPGNLPNRLLSITFKGSNSGMACSILDLKTIFDIYVSRALIPLLCILELSGLVREIFFVTSFRSLLGRRARSSIL